MTICENDRPGVTSEAKVHCTDCWSASETAKKFIFQVTSVAAVAVRQFRNLRTRDLVRVTMHAERAQPIHLQTFAYLHEECVATIQRTELQLLTVDQEVHVQEYTSTKWAVPIPPSQRMHKPEELLDTMCSSSNNVTVLFKFGLQRQRWARQPLPSPKANAKPLPPRP